MKYFLIWSIFFFSSLVSAEQLHDFEQIKTAMLQGKLIRIVVDYTKCTTTAKNPQMAIKNIPAGASAYTPNEIGIDSDKNYMAAALMHFTLTDPQFPNKPVYDFVRYTIKKDGGVDISYTPLNAADYTQLAEKLTFNCEMDSAAVFHTV